MPTASMAPAPSLTTALSAFQDGPELLGMGRYCLPKVHSVHEARSQMDE